MKSEDGHIINYFSELNYQAEYKKLKSSDQPMKSSINIIHRWLKKFQSPIFRCSITDTSNLNIIYAIYDEIEKHGISLSTLKFSDKKIAYQMTDTLKGMTKG